VSKKATLAYCVGRTWFNHASK